MVPHRRILGGGVTCKMRGREGVSGGPWRPPPPPPHVRGGWRHAARGALAVFVRAPRHLKPPHQATFVRGCGEGVGEGRRDGAARGGGGRSVLPAASALAKLWKGELVPPLSSSAATDCCPIILVRLLVGDSKTSMRFGEHDGSIGDDISASNPRSRGRFWHASIVRQPPTAVHREAQRRAERVEDTERFF